MLLLTVPHSWAFWFELYTRRIHSKIQIIQIQLISFDCAADPSRDQFYWIIQFPSYSSLFFRERENQVVSGGWELVARITITMRDLYQAWMFDHGRVNKSRPRYEMKDVLFIEPSVVIRKHSAASAAGIVRNSKSHKLKSEICRENSESHRARCSSRLSSFVVRHSKSQQTNNHKLLLLRLLRSKKFI